MGIPGADRTQAVLLPEVLEDYVRQENPVRFLDAFVKQLDLGALGFQRALPAETGRPGYDPGDLLRLYLYGYLRRIRSSRRLEQATHGNVELMWLLWRLTPDFKTIADSRRDHTEAPTNTATHAASCGFDATSVSRILRDPQELVRLQAQPPAGTRKAVLERQLRIPLALRPIHRLD